MDKIRSPDPKDLSEMLRYEASTSSGFKIKRSEGGQRAVVMEKYHQHVGISQSYSETVGNQVLQRDYPLPDLGEYLSLAGSCALDLFQRTPDESYEIRKLKCETHAITEPLKVRMITKGEPLPYFFSKFAQKYLWDILKCLEPFELIGKPIEKAMIGRVTTLQWRKFLVSGDYSAATDNLSIKVTREIWSIIKEVLFGEFPDYLVNLWESTLLEHEVSYPAKTGLNTVIQTNGQLMGSVLSFPILCIANFVGYWISREREVGTPLAYSLIAREVLVNGDDILFGTDEVHYSIWKKVVDEIGFELSLGKNYIHESTFCINSTFFERYKKGAYDLGSELYSYMDTYHSRLGLPCHFHFRKIEWVNLGLLVGQTKLGKVSNHAPLGDYYNLILSSVPEDRKQVVHAKFMFYHAQRISRQTDHGKLNLFLPCELGGLGFKIDTYLPSFEVEYINPVYEDPRLYIISSSDTYKHIQSRKYLDRDERTPLCLEGLKHASPDHLMLTDQQRNWALYVIDRSEDLGEINAVRYIETSCVESYERKFYSLSMESERGEQDLGKLSDGHLRRVLAVTTESVTGLSERESPLGRDHKNSHEDEDFIMVKPTFCQKGKKRKILKSSLNCYNSSSIPDLDSFLLRCNVRILEVPSCQLDIHIEYLSGSQYGAGSRRLLVRDY
jgi:hypothetical protein